MPKYLSLTVICLTLLAAIAAPRHVAANEPDKVLRHVVLFAFKADASAEQVKQIEQAFAALPEKIDTIHDFEWGTNVSVENHDQGFTHCFVVTFLDEKGRGEYLPHPAHKAFVKLLLPSLEKVLVIDYWTKK